MADILIRGMEMPERCEKCRFCKRWEEGIYCGATATPILGHGNARLNNCPLIEVPPHGRLIDADELKKHKKHSEEFAENIVAVAQIDWIPTVIPADKDGET